LNQIEFINANLNDKINEKAELIENNKILETNLNKIKNELSINNEIQDK